MADELISDDVRWKIVTTEERFEQFRTQPAFWALVALGRAISALRSVQMPLLSHENDDSPAASRARQNSLFFSCALYAESLLLIQDLNKYFGNLPSFQELTKVTTKNAKAQDALKWSITKLRNKLVFHFDIDEIGNQLQQMEPTPPTFISTMGATNSQVHYELADLCAWQTLVDPSSSKTNLDQDQVANRLDAIAALITDFTDAAESFIVDVLMHNGWYRL
jgi:hypothetical protein